MAAGWRSTLKDKAQTVKSLFACRQKPSRTTLVRHMLIVLFLLIGFGVATYVGWQLHQGEQEKWDNQVVQWCKERCNMLELDIMTNAKHVEVFTAFVEEFKKEVTEDSSRSQRFLDRTEYARPSVYGMDWSMLVLDEDRRAYEAYWDTTIKDKSTGLSEDRRPTYYPITLVSSNLTSLRFFDRQTISLQDNSWQAALKGEFVISPPYPESDRPSMREFTMCWPTFRHKLSENATPAERVEAVDGLVTAVFLFTALVERFLSQHVASKAFSFHVYDVTDPGPPAVLYVPEREVALNVSMARIHSKHVMTMSFGEPSRKHEMWCWYEKRSVGRFSILWGTFIAVFVVLIACVLWATIRRMEMAEENYVKMEKLKTEAEAADRAKSNFLATMSHELRTPMNGVLGMLNILKDTDLDAQQAEYARTASSCANTLITLVNDILDLAKVESGHMDLERTPFDLRAICGEVLDIFREEARKKNVELATLVAPDVPPLVYGDPVRLRQVFINFVGNSLKFTQQGHVFLRIGIAKPVQSFLSKTPVSAHAPSSSRALREPSSAPAKFGTLSGRKTADESNSWEALTGESEVLLGPIWHSPLALKGGGRERQSKVLLLCSCEDTGLGIPEGVQQQIFRPFIQAHRSTTREYGGTGIGLSICQKLIGMMGSEIKLASEVGVGSTFYFTLEMDAEASPVGESREGRMRTNKEQARKFAQLKGRRTLVAAPRLVRRLVLVNALQALGLEVDVVDTIEDATAVLFQDLLRGEGADVRTGGTSPESGRGAASAVSVVERAFECLVLDTDDWGSDPVLDLAERVWVDHRARGQLADCCAPVVLVAACSFTPEMEERIGRIQCTTKLHKPISSTACGAAITKALGRGTEAPGIEKPDGQQTKGTSVRGIHVLLVDDNLVNQKIVCKILERSSIAFTAVDRAETAIAALQKGHPFDAVFMDIQMPEMDGIEATQIIRAKDVKSTNPAHGRIPIFAMTADVMKDMQVQCREAGMDGFIPKPLDHHKLFDVLAPFFPSS